MGRFEITNIPERIDWECGSDEVRRTLQNAKNLLMTRLGEVPYDRLRGFDHSLFDLPMPVLRARLLPELDRVMMWEPDVEVVEASCALTADGETVIRCVIEIGFA